jgi:hypothetical protein
MLRNSHRVTADSFFGGTETNGIELTERHPMINQPTQIISTLFDYQKRAIYEAAQVEQRARITPKNKIPARICFGDPCGAGKTMMCLGLIAHSDPIRAPSYYMTSEYLLRGSLPADTKLINTTMVICSGPILEQWEAQIANHTTFTYFKIETGKDVIAYLANDYVYDIVLIKLGKMKAQSQMVFCHQHLLENSPIFKRIIVDDPDVIEFPFYTKFTTSGVVYSDRLGLSKYTCSEIIMSATKGEDEHFYKIYSQTGLIKQEAKLPKIVWKKYVFDPLSDRLLDVMKEMGCPDIVDMINGEAVLTVAKRVNAVSNSIADIFRAIINRECRDYKKLKRRIVKIGKLTELAVNPRKGELTQEDIDLAAKITIGKIVPKDIDAANIHENILVALVNMSNTSKQSIEKVNKQIERIKYKLSGGSCSICLADFAELREQKDQCIIIQRCCSTIICGSCYVNMKPNYGTNFRCPVCRVTSHYTKNALYVDASKDIDEMIQEDNSELTCDIQDELPSDKMNCLIDLIRNRRVDQFIEGDNPNPDKIMESEVDIPRPITETPRFLVFAGHSSIIDRIKTTLDQNNIACQQYKRAISPSKKQLRDFKIGKFQVLLMDSEEMCSGLELQFVSDIIFFHRIRDDSITIQFTGRAQRVGRSYNLVVHSLYNQNECTQSLRA